MRQNYFPTVRNMPEYLSSDISLAKFLTIAVSGSESILTGIRKPRCK